MASKIVKNEIKCIHCEDTIESKHTHDFKSCSCGKVYVDGGRSYLRRVGNREDYEELSVVLDPETMGAEV